jgi:hypothetical protein
MSEAVRMTSHTVSTTLTTWTCSCGRHGVLLTSEEREAFLRCPFDQTPGRPRALLRGIRVLAGTAAPARDLDWADVYADALNDPTLDRDCEEGSECADDACPLIHPDPEHVCYDASCCRIYSDRAETDTCEAGTPGCCIDHRRDSGSCEGF